MNHIFIKCLYESNAKQRPLKISLSCLILFSGILSPLYTYSSDRLSLSVPTKAALASTGIIACMLLTKYAVNQGGKYMRAYDLHSMFNLDRYTQECMQEFTQLLTVADYEPDGEGPDEFISSFSKSHTAFMNSRRKLLKCLEEQEMRHGGLCVMPYVRSLMGWCHPLTPHEVCQQHHQAVGRFVHTLKSTYLADLPRCKIIMLLGGLAHEEVRSYAYYEEELHDFDKVLLLVSTPPMTLDTVEDYVLTKSPALNPIFLKMKSYKDQNKYIIAYLPLYASSLAYVAASFADQIVISRNTHMQYLAGIMSPPNEVHSHCKMYIMYGGVPWLGQEFPSAPFSHPVSSKEEWHEVVLTNVPYNTRNNQVWADNVITVKGFPSDYAQQHERQYKALTECHLPEMKLWQQSLVDILHAQRPVLESTLADRRHKLFTDWVTAISEFGWGDQYIPEGGAYIEKCGFADRTGTFYDAAMFLRMHERRQQQALKK